jgi:hypothetical protein
VLCLAVSRTPFGAEIGSLVDLVICRFVTEGTNRIGFDSVHADRRTHEMLCDICTVWGGPDNALPRVDVVQLSGGQTERDLQEDLGRRPSWVNEAAEREG